MRTRYSFLFMKNVTDFLFGKGVAHDMLSQRLLAGLVISGDAISCINTEPAVAPVHEFLDEIIGYLSTDYVRINADYRT